MLASLRDVLLIIILVWLIVTFNNAIEGTKSLHTTFDELGTGHVPIQKGSTTK